MARKRKSRSKDKTLLITATKRISEAGQTSKTHNRGKEVHESASRKRKTVSETSRPRKRSKRIKKVNSSSSVELVRVQPCCSSERERKKYAKLGLDSALFFSSSKPAKRKQSHISVITISSSDDEDSNYDKTAKTADWISKMDMEIINISSNEEPFPSGDADLSQNDFMAELIIDSEKFRPQKSSTQICLTPEPIFKPLCASTPQKKHSIVQPPYFSTPETQENHLQTYKGPSFLENPATNLRHQLTALKLSESRHTTVSSEPNCRGHENKVKSVLTSTSCSPEFYFGPIETLQNEQLIFGNGESTGPIWSDGSYFSSTQTSKANTLEKEFGRQEAEAIRYSLEQVPSTSNAPVSNPVLEVAPKKKKIKEQK